MNRILLSALLLAVVFSIAKPTRAQADTAVPTIAVTLVADPNAARHKIPEDYLGLSFEMNQLLPGTDGIHQFSPANKALCSLLKTMGVKSLRFGGNAADAENLPDPKEADVDAAFELARSIGARLIYTLRFSKEGRLRAFVPADAHAAAAMSRYILERYPEQIAAFTIGNEPNMYFSRISDQYVTTDVAAKKSEKNRHDYEAYRDAWKKFAATVSASNPDAKFNGPSTTGDPSWAKWFSTDFAQDGRIAFFSNHWYPGGNGKKGEAEPKLKEALSPQWHQKYEKYLVESGFPAMTRPFRIEEMNSYYFGGAPDMSDSMAAALWALDFGHWFAARGCAGLNFHTCTQLNFHADSDYTFNYTSFLAVDGGYQLRPIGYGLMLLHLGSMGKTVPITVGGGDGLNLAAYAVAGTDGNLYLTLINKSYDSAASTADVNFKTLGRSYKTAESLLLQAPNNDVRAKSGVTIGGAPVARDGTWAGHWEPLPASALAADGSVSVTVQPSRACVIKLR